MIPTPILQQRKKKNRNSLNVKYNSRIISWNYGKICSYKLKKQTRDKILDSSKKKKKYPLDIQT